MKPEESGKWRAFYAAALGWLFDGYESYVLILVAANLIGLLFTPFAGPETKGRPLPP